MTNDEAEMWRKTLLLHPMRWHSNELDPLLELLPDNATVAELGCFAGESTLMFLNCPKVRFVLAVDAWCGSYDPDDYASSADMVAARTAFNMRVNRFQNLIVLRCDIVKAAEVPTDPFDLVYLDADHREDVVRSHIEAWRKLVKPGGIFAGHDYSSDAHPGVKSAVDGIFGVHGPVNVLPDTSWWVRL